MEKLIVKFETLDGYYYLTVLNDYSYTIDTNINGFECGNGFIDNQKEFTKMIDESNISAWDCCYNPDGLAIEDAVKWSVQLDNHKSQGVEGYWPYYYDRLIEAILFIDDKVSYFKANIS